MSLLRMHPLLRSAAAHPAAVLTPFAHTRSASSQSEGKLKKKDMAGDKRYQVLKSMLYEGPGRTKPTPSTTTLTASPELSPEQLEQREVIERMWALTKQREAGAQMEELKRKYISMRKAIEELEKTDRRLFEGAVKREEGDPDAVVQFPRKLRVPTYTPPVSNSK
ncbi:hypothetical protein HK102_013436 [Quaeritorhiza haematococci]|nr:hypothetical protein HK102_013436 [Quaeritorhiza haematococci]